MTLSRSVVRDGFTPSSRYIRIMDQVIARQFLHRGMVDMLALSFSREFPTDPRPELLQWCFWRDESLAGVAFSFTAAHVAAYTGRLDRAEPISRLAIVLASTDAMYKARDRTKATVTIETRARQVRIARAVYGDMRDVGEHYLKDALRTGRDRYYAARGLKDVFTEKVYETSAFTRAAAIAIRNHAGDSSDGPFHAKAA
jgi:hypothetical protein